MSNLKASLTLSVVLAGALSAQGPGDVRPTSQDGALSDADVKKLSDLLIAWYPPKERDGKPVKIDQKKVDAAEAEFAKEIERLKKAAGDKLVSDFKGWSEVFYRFRAANMVKSPSGFGTPQVAKTRMDVGATTLEFTYAYVLPNGFDARNKYPLLICLHDESDGEKDYTGQKYLEEVYLKAPKELRDQFIYLAPNIGPKAGGKDVRIEFGDDAQFFNVYRPLNDMLLRFPIDADRICVEGTGRGGELAANLVSYKPQQWAGAAIRSALPRNVKLLANAPTVGMAFHYRQGGRVTNAKDALAAVEAMKAAGAPVVTAAYDALATGADQKARAGMANDPVHDATGPILSFLLERRRMASPKTFSFSTDKARFRFGYWVRLGRFDFETKPARIDVKVNDADNVIELTSSQIEDFRLLLSDAVIDLGRPVKVVVNGKPVFEGKRERSFDEFFANWNGNRIDPSIVPCATIDVVVPAADPAPANGEAGKTDPAAGADKK